MSYLGMSREELSRGLNAADRIYKDWVRKQRNKDWKRRKKLGIKAVKRTRVRLPQEITARGLFILSDDPIEERWRTGIGGYAVQRIKGFLGNVECHRLQMERTIGRLLKAEEIVHHWNQVKNDSRKENLCLFRTTGAHLRVHAFANRHNIPVDKLRFEQPWLTRWWE